MLSPFLRRLVAPWCPLREMCGGCARSRRRGKPQAGGDIELVRKNRELVGAPSPLVSSRLECDRRRDSRDARGSRSSRQSTSSALRERKRDRLDDIGSVAKRSVNRRHLQTSSPRRRRMQRYLGPDRVLGVRHSSCRRRRSGGDLELLEATARPCTLHTMLARRASETEIFQAAGRGRAV